MIGKRCRKQAGVVTGPRALTFLVNRIGRGKCFGVGPVTGRFACKGTARSIGLGGHIGRAVGDINARRETIGEDDDGYAHRIEVDG